MSLDISATGYVAFRFAGDAFVGFNVATCSQIVFCAVRFACNLDITAACQAAFYSCQIDIGGYYAPGAGQIDFQLVSFYFLFQRILPLPAMLISSFPIFIGLAIMKSPEDTTFNSFISRELVITLNLVG